MTRSEIFEITGHHKASHPSHPHQPGFSCEFGGKRHSMKRPTIRSYSLLALPAYLL